jgi:hypothetical protein
VREGSDVPRTTYALEDFRRRRRSCIQAELSGVGLVGDSEHGCDAEAGLQEARGEGGNGVTWDGDGEASVAAIPILT